MIGRREFIGGLGGTTLAWPLAARAQQPALPVIGFLSAQSLEGFPGNNCMATFYAGLCEFGYAEGWNVSVEYNWPGGAIRSRSGVGGRTGAGAPSRGCTRYRGGHCRTTCGLGSSAGAV
jgi:hypothetical protein